MKKSWAINKDDSILITGGSGFLGKHVAIELKTRGYGLITYLSSKEIDLTKDCVEQISLIKPNICIHLAAYCSGIGGNMADPLGHLVKNVKINMNTVDACLKLYLSGFAFKKFVGIGSICSYPRDCPVPFKEEDLFLGKSEPTNFFYGEAKKLMLTHLEAAEKQYAFPFIYLMPVNMYGRGDRFDENRSHVIPALIKKFLYAVKNNEKQVVCWGTGEASREFFYVEDAARGICDAMEKYNHPEPLNLGTGKEIKIKDLADLIAELTGFNGKIIWDTSKPDGQPRRQLDVNRARECFGFSAQVELKDGLKKVIEWYKG